MVRFAEYLQRKNVSFLCVCATESYAFADLKQKGIALSSILAIEGSTDYYYADDKIRKQLIEEITNRIKTRPARIVSFCMRDLYTASAVSARLPRVSLSHLILHIQDDLYLGQTILDKFVYQLIGQRRFGNTRTIELNRRILTMINMNGGLICMSDLIAEVWRRNFGVFIRPEHIIPLPSFSSALQYSVPENNNHKILWIGRLVDFKIPALLAMIEFLSVSSLYSLTIVGDGDRSAVLARMKDCAVSEDRVHFMGEVSYAELGDVILKHSIGYAMGTSLVELARFRIPVVVALASYSHKPFDRPICGGVFFNQPRGCDGSELAISSEDQYGKNIVDVMGEIEADWKGAAHACYKYSRDNYSVEENFSAYEKNIENARWLSDVDKAISLPTAPLVRRLLFLLINWWRK